MQKVTPRQVKPRVSRMRGHLSKRTQFVREVVKEVAGYVSDPTHTRIRKLRKLAQQGRREKRQLLT